jgi:hypothetical protein
MNRIGEKYTWYPQNPYNNEHLVCSHKGRKKKSKNVIFEFQPKKEQNMHFNSSKWTTKLLHVNLHVNSLYSSSKNHLINSTIFILNLQYKLHPFYPTN